MEFVRCLDEKQRAALHNAQNGPLYARLKADVFAGLVYPAVRKNQLHFYYKGGCLYKFANGTFTRDPAYCKYGNPTPGLTDYQLAKRQNENKFTAAIGRGTERQLLDELYCYTFGRARTGRAVVLDIEVNLNSGVGRGKKCDLVLYDTATRALLFVEGKLFSDSRVNVRRGRSPAVIEQVETYTAAVAEQAQTILRQYKNHIAVCNDLFGTDYPDPVRVCLPAKLLVYQTPATPTENHTYSIAAVEAALGYNNVAWVKQNERPTPDEIWERLCK